MRFSVVEGEQQKKRPVESPARCACVLGRDKKLSQHRYHMDRDRQWRGRDGGLFALHSQGKPFPFSARASLTIRQIGLEELLGEQRSLPAHISSLHVRLTSIQVMTRSASQAYDVRHFESSPHPFVARYPQSCPGHY